MGEIVADLREQAGLTGAELAEAVGIGSKQALSNIERGDNGIPPERVADFAKALNVDPKEFAKTTLRYSDPWRYALIFGADEVLKAELEEAGQRIGKRRGPIPRK